MRDVALGQLPVWVELGEARLDDAALLILKPLSTRHDGGIAEWKRATAWVSVMRVATCGNARARVGAGESQCRARGAIHTASMDYTNFNARRNHEGGAAMRLISMVPSLARLAAFCLASGRGPCSLTTGRSRGAFCSRSGRLGSQCCSTSSQLSSYELSSCVTCGSCSPSLHLCWPAVIAK